MNFYLNVYLLVQRLTDKFILKLHPYNYKDMSFKGIDKFK